jgi:hypothetical protein
MRNHPYMLASNPASLANLNKVIALEARAMAERGEIVDLPRAKCRALIGLMEQMEAGVWAGVDLALSVGDADLTDQLCASGEAVLQFCEEQKLTQILELMQIDPERGQRRAAHVASRGVRKVRGAK